MDRIIAARLLRAEMLRHAALPHAVLAGRIGDGQAYEIEGPDGVAYQIEVEMDWAREPGGAIQVMAGIDDGSFRGALAPVTDGFVMDTDGRISMATEEPG